MSNPSAPFSLLHAVVLPLAVSGFLLIVAISAAVAGDDDDTRAIDCDNAMSTYEMNACADREFVAADAALNRTYKKAVAEIPGMAVEDSRYDTKAWTAALRASQRAWLAFRDAECQGHVAMFWTGGTGATAEIIGCMTEKTKARTKELAEAYEKK